jgi:hypothetical protein
VPPHPAAALLGKRWDLLAEYKDQYWREQKQLGLREALRVVDALRTQAQFFNPTWPTPEDREADLETHIRPPRRSRAPRQGKPSRAPNRPAPHHVPRESLDAIVAFAKLAEQENLRWYLFGAQAVATYGVPRTTGDVDITVDLGDRSLSLLVAPLRRAGFIPRISDESFAMETRIYPVTHKPTGWNFDLVLAGPGLKQRFLDEVRIVAVEGGPKLMP